MRSARLCVRLYVCPLAYLKNHVSKLYAMYMMLPVAVDRSSYDDYATHYVFTVLSITSCFHIQIKKTMVTNSQLIRQGGRHGLSSHTMTATCAPGARSAIPSKETGLNTALQELTCHMGSHSVACHPAEVTFPPLHQQSRYST